MSLDTAVLPSAFLSAAQGRPHPRALATPRDDASLVSHTAQHAAAEIQDVTTIVLHRIAPGAVSPERVRNTMFSTLPEVHATELGIAIGLVVAVLFITGHARLGVVATVIVTILAIAGPTDLMMSTMALMHMWTEPWYFLSPFGVTVGVAAARSGSVQIRVRERILFLGVFLRHRVLASYGRRRGATHRLTQHVTVQAPDALHPEGRIEPSVPTTSEKVE